MLLSSPSSIFPGVLATPLTLFIQSNKSLEYVGMTFYWKFSHGTYLSILSVNFVSIAGNPLLHFFDHVNAKKKKHFTWLLKTKEGTSLFIESLPSVISDNLTHIKCKKKQKKKMQGKPWTCSYWVKPFNITVSYSTNKRFSSYINSKN